MDIIESIRKYLLFLKSECRLSVSLHPYEGEELITFSELMLYNLHDNSYCAAVKALSGDQRICQAHQKKVHRRARQLGCPFSGVCHAGVFEFVYPIKNGDEVLGFISVGAYAADSPKGYIEKTAERFGVCREQLLPSYSTLESRRPEVDRIDTLIAPLVSMLELAYKKQDGKPRDGEGLIGGIIRYVRQNYTSDLTVDLICREFSCSRSYLSHSFRSAAGKSLRDYISELRLTHARHLLEVSDLSVTEIAFLSGFNDSNYFSDAFKKKLGISPLAYRKRSHGNEEKRNSDEENLK